MSSGNKQNPNQACIGCRTIKVKCRTATSAQGRCSRCERLDMVCEYRSSKRGRPVKYTHERRSITDTPDKDDSLSKNNTEASSGSGSGSGNGPSGHPISDDRTAHRCSKQSRVIYTNSDNIPVSGTVIPRATHYSPDSYANKASPIASSSNSGSSRSPVRLPVRFLDGEQRNPISVNIVESLDPCAKSSAPHSAPPLISMSSRDSRYGDPIKLGFLSQLEAQHLVQSFHEHLNPLIALFDPSVHTLDYIHSGSVILLNAILAASARFFRRDIAGPLYSHAQQTVGRAMTDGICELGLIQALCILVFWKPPSDNTAYLKVGYAIRLGFQLNLHVPRTDPLPENSADANRILDAERTWQVLYFFDASYSDPFALPRVINRSQVRDLVKWIKEFPRDHRSTDGKLASSLVHDDLVRQLQFSQQIRSQRSLSTQVLDYVDNQAILYSREWLSNDQNPPYPLQKWSLQSERLHYQYLRCNLSKAKLRLCEDSHSVIENFTEISKLIDRVQEIADERRLLYYQDVAAIILSKVGIMMHELFNIAEGSLKPTILNLMIKVFTICTEAADGEDDVAPAYVSRFYTRLLNDMYTVPQASNTDTQVFPRSPQGTRNASIMDINNNRPAIEGEPVPPADNAISFDERSSVWVDLENLLSVSGVDAQDALWTDASYWSSLFSELPESAFLQTNET